MAKKSAKLRVAILGSGNIGADLLVKTQRSEYLECSLFIGRNLNSAGMIKAKEYNVRLSDKSINAAVDFADDYDILFDATSARDHLIHAPILKKLNKKVIDMTPSRVGQITVPAVDFENDKSPKTLAQNVNMISCGGQASIPLAYALGKTHKNIEYIEVVSSIASKSAGPATRLNLDEYIETTEHGVETYSGCQKSKVILILNPAEPCINMQTTVSAKIKDPNMDQLKIEVENIVSRVKAYVPGYQLIVAPIYENGRVFMMVKAEGLGDYLPAYAGNLDIINCAAIASAENYAKYKLMNSNVQTNFESVRV